MRRLVDYSGLPGTTNKLTWRDYQQKIQPHSADNQWRDQWENKIRDCKAGKGWKNCQIHSDRERIQDNLSDQLGLDNAQPCIYYKKSELKSQNMSPGDIESTEGFALDLNNDRGHNPYKKKRPQSALEFPGHNLDRQTLQVGENIAQWHKEDSQAELVHC